MIDLDGKFHTLIWEATQNRFLISNLEYYYNLSLRIWYLALPQAAADEIDVEAHCGIFQEIAAGNADAAAARIKRVVGLA